MHVSKRIDLSQKIILHSPNYWIIRPDRKNPENVFGIPGSMVII